MGEPLRQTTTVLPRAAVAGTVVAVCCGAGFLFGDLLTPLAANRMLPWIVARATGIGAFVALTALTLLGLLFRRPATTEPKVHRETILRLHVALGPALAALVVAHVAALLADRYAGVGWAALVVPLSASYRPGAVTYGMAAAWLVILVMATAGLAGRGLVGPRWAVVHRLAYPAFVLTWVHGVLAGSDTTVLRGLYIAAGLAVGVATVPVINRRSALQHSGRVLPHPGDAAR